MTKQDFLKKYFELMRFELSEGMLERDLIVTISNAGYGRSSIAVLQLEGSPPKLTIIIDVYSAWFDSKQMPTAPDTHLFVDGFGSIRKNAKNRGEAIQLVYQYLISNGHIKI